MSRRFVRHATNSPYVIPSSSFPLRRSLFVAPFSSLPFRRSLFVARSSSFPLRHSLIVIPLIVIPSSSFPLRHSLFVIPSLKTSIVSLWAITVLYKKTGFPKHKSQIQILKTFAISRPCFTLSINSYIVWKSLWLRIR